MPDHQIMAKLKIAIFLVLSCALLNSCQFASQSAEDLFKEKPSVSDPEGGSGSDDSDDGESGADEGSGGGADEGSGGGADETGPNQNIVLQSDMNLRTLRSGVLEFLVLLKKGSTIQIPKSAQTVNYHYRDSQGSLVFSSTGFYPRVKVLSGPYTENEILSLNTLVTGLYISATVSGASETGDVYPAVKLQPASPQYFNFFDSTGRPKKAYTQSLHTRFPNSANRVIELSSLPQAQQIKWAKIMTELRRLGDRTQPSLKSDFIIDKELAMKFAIDFEKTGAVQKRGAWSIAVQGTAVRNGFSNVPCAEFMSEVLRQAYVRAGYSHFEDFNSTNKNTLNFFNGAAAVVNFSAYLERAGWIPWDPQIFVPPTGALMMHAQGKSPGHTYMIAGQRGRLIVDNGMPQGRDLGQTSQNTLEIMYQHGVFFLPPGMIPQRW